MWVQILIYLSSYFYIFLVIILIYLFKFFWKFFNLIFLIFILFIYLFLVFGIYVGVEFLTFNCKSINYYYYYCYYYIKSMISQKSRGSLYQLSRKR